MLENPIFTLCISIILFIWYFLFTKRLKTNIIFIISCFFYINITILYIIANYYTGEGIDLSFIFHLKYGIDGAWLAWEIHIIIFALFWLFISFLLPYLYYKKYFKKKKKRIYKKNTIFNMLHIYSYLLLIISIIIHPFSDNIYKIFGTKSFSTDNVENNKKFNDIYKIPKNPTNIKKKKNLVFIYLESFEQLFTNEEIFPGLTPEINKIKEKAIVFDNIRQSYWWSRTIAGMVSSQCGIPLLDSGWGGNSMHGIKTFLPKAYCIGDFLKSAWYYLSYIWWADKKFAWKWNFYNTHKFDTVEWREEFIDKLEDKNYIYDWWLYDDTTFNIAKKKFDELLEKQQPFWLFMINMDTHGKDGVVSKSCKNLEFKNNEFEILKSYHCTDFQVAKLIKYIQEKDKDTVIVLLSDHYAMNMNSAIWKIKENEEDRRLLFMILDNNIVIKKEHKFWETIDIAPTVLSYLWFQVPHLWMWTNLLGNIPSLRKRVPNFRFANWNNYYRSFWSFPSLKNGIELKELKSIIEKEIIAIPSIIELDDEKNITNIVFEDEYKKLDFQEYIPEWKASIAIDYAGKWKKILIFTNKEQKQIKKNYKDWEKISFDTIKKIFTNM